MALDDCTDCAIVSGIRFAPFVSEDTYTFNYTVHSGRWSDGLRAGTVERWTNCPLKQGSEVQKMQSDESKAPG